MQPNLLRNLCFLPTKNTKHRTFYRTHFLLISITCLSRYISLSFYRPALIEPIEYGFGGTKICSGGHQKCFNAGKTLHSHHFFYRGRKRRLVVHLFLQSMVQTDTIYSHCNNSNGKCQHDAKILFFFFIYIQEGPSGSQNVFTSHKIALWTTDEKQAFWNASC